MAGRDRRLKPAPHDPQRASQKRDPTAGLSIDFLKSCGLSEFTVDRKQDAALSFIALQPRIEKVLDVLIAREVEKLGSSLLVLATVASAGSFVGLFGTVWGIVALFRSIAASRNTLLAAVAPGKAEAFRDRDRALRGDP
jgi:biopolymer transport protein TolQ